MDLSDFISAPGMKECGPNRAWRRPASLVTAEAGGQSFCGFYHLNLSVIFIHIMVYFVRIKKTLAIISRTMDVELKQCLTEF